MTPVPFQLLVVRPMDQYETPNASNRNKILAAARKRKIPILIPADLAHQKKKGDGPSVLVVDEMKVLRSHNLMFRMPLKPKGAFFYAPDSSPSGVAQIPFTQIDKLVHFEEDQAYVEWNEIRRALENVPLPHRPSRPFLKLAIFAVFLLIGIFLLFHR